MGAEEFQVTLTTPRSLEAVTRRFREDPTFRPIDSLGSQRRHYLFEDDLHIVEFEISEEAHAVRISARFALCQYESADACFTNLVLALAREFGASLVINDEVEVGDAWSFASPEAHDIEDIIHRAVRKKRSLWVADFGAERAKVTCAGAVERFILRGSGAG